jgi:hypothetical protein
MYENRSAAVGRAAGYGLDDVGAGVRLSLGLRIFIAPCRPDRLWGPSSLLSIWHQGFFRRGKAARA